MSNSTSTPHLILIDQISEEPALSKDQKKFNNLVKKIDELKQALSLWQDTLPRYNAKVTEEFEGLRSKFEVRSVDWVMLLDRLYEQPLFKKADRAKLKHLILEATATLVNNPAHEGLKEIYNKYAGSDFDADRAAEDELASEFVKSMLRDEYGLDLGDDIDLSTPEKLQAVLDEKLQQEQAQQAEQDLRRSQRKKSAKQLAKEERLRAEEQNVSKSIQEVFRKLAAALHPDREPDADERARKTALMQRVNAAYGKKDLLQLLALQLEVEQIDQANLNSIAKDRLKYFIKILNDQLNELRDEIADIEEPLKMSIGFPIYTRLTPERLMSALERDISALRNDIRRLEHEIKVFANPANLKSWLKGFKIPKPSDLDADDLFFPPNFDPFDRF